ncbi:MAG TPA: acyl-CoA dehydrogenase family protein [Acidimicrobiia bacterium]|jgi:alkylation response protein AidB-like acyl-CoA dehydrogenase|nr:acyl-CoA dehydrogenase family protein [Acidimicrobiia bacterium]
MEIGYTPEQLAMQQELRAYYDKLLDPATVAELHESHAVGEAPRRIWKQMCADGWAGIGWPKEYGGQGRSAIEQFIFFDESMRAGAPVPMLTLNSVGPTIMAFGTDEQKADYLPRILSGDIHFCIGYSEPGAGTDLASLKTRAVRDGESYVINGQKMWTSLSSDADYCWLAVRTDPDAAKHKGISMIIVPMDTPGITLSPLHLLGTHDINAVFYEDVVVPAANVIGGENHGWKLITNQLNHERVTLFASGVMDRALSEVTQYAQETKLPDGRRVIDQPWVQHNLAKLQAKVEVVRLMNWQVAWEATQGVLDIGHCSALKVFGSELNMEGYQLLMEILGPVSYLEPDAPGAVLKSRIQQGTRGAIILTFGGGVNEMQRDLISQFTLGFPRADR